MHNVARESAAVRAFREWILEHPSDCYGLKIKGDKNTRDQPDYIGVYKGRCFAFEFKAVGAVPRKSQASIIRKWKRAGAIVGAPTSRDEAVALLRAAVDLQLTQGVCHE